MSFPKSSNPSNSSEGWGSTQMRFLWAMLRPMWPSALAAFSANLISTLFEGSTIALLAVAIQVIGGLPGGGSSPLLLGAMGERLSHLQAAMGREGLFLSLVLAAVLAQILRSGFQFLGETLTARLQVQVHMDMYGRVFERIFRMPFPRISAYPLGDLTDYLGQTKRLFELLSSVNVLVRNALFVGIYGLLLLWLSWPLTLAAMAGLWGVTRLLRGVIANVERSASRYTEATVRLNRQATELLQALRLVHTLARQHEVIRFVQALARNGMASLRRATVLYRSVESITDALTAIGIGMFLVGGYLVLVPRGLITLPSLVAFLLALYRVTPRLRCVYASLAELANLAPHVERMVQILRTDEAEVERKEGRMFPGLHDAIKFDRVTLRYVSDESPAVESLSFRVPKGSFTALVGVSGAGKSTVTDLLLGLYEPTAGSVVIDGIDLKMIDPVSWRRHISVVSQEPFLFHASIRENILFGKPTATDAEIATAAQAAYAEEFIARLSDGYDTVVGDRGYRLSGGQCQRIALARALVRQPDLLVLDEATSALDSESERWIQQALDEQRGTRTVIAIAHRLSTVSHADHILVLEDGRLAEQGTHHALLARHGIYARLWALQSESKQPAPPLPGLAMRAGGVG